jgi:hypothetical protein
LRTVTVSASVLAIVGTTLSNRDPLKDSSWGGRNKNCARGEILRCADSAQNDLNDGMDPRPLYNGLVVGQGWVV